MTQTNVRVGAWVELRQSTFGDGTVWLPFLVTHVYDDGKVSGVAFSGEPGSLGWMNRAAQACDHVEQGDAVSQWRVPEPDPEPEPEEPKKTTRKRRTRTKKTE